MHSVRKLYSKRLVGMLHEEDEKDDIEERYK